MARTVAIFGGSFNPPHVGHVLAVAYVLSVCDVDGVMVVPVFDHPFDKELVPFERRMEMAQAAVGWIAGVEVSDIERNLGGESRTLYTIEALLEQQPERELRLVIGSDVIADLAKWHRWDRIEQLAPPIIVGRAGYDVAGAPSAILPEVSSTEIRRLMKQGRDDELTALVPWRVLELIRAHALYAPVVATP